MSRVVPKAGVRTSPVTARLGAIVVCASTLAFVPSATAAAPPASASWHGRAIQRPVQGRQNVDLPTAFPAAWSAGPVRLGTGFRRQGGSTRVREVQRRLWALGFRPGPVDGLFGPRTQAAVQWFQIKHGLTPDGVVGVATLTLLRQRTGAASGEAAPLPSGAGTPRVAAQPRPAAQPAGASGGTSADRRRGGPAAKRGRGSSRIVPPAVALLAILLLFGAWLPVAARKRRRTRPPKRRRSAAVGRRTVGGPAPQGPAASPTARPLAFGYVRGNDGRALTRNTAAIERECLRRGWALAELLRDEDGQGRSGSLRQRPGLTRTLERVGGPAADGRLVVSRLGHLSRSAGELKALFDWFAQHEVGVVVLDVGLDTTTSAGRRGADSLIARVARRQAQARAAINGNGNGNGTGNGPPAANRKAAAKGGNRARERGDPD